MTYVYDGNDQLRRVTRKVNGVTSGSEDYFYGGSGQRFGVVERDAAGTKTKLRWFIGDTEAHYTGANAAVLSTVFTHISLGTPLARIKRTGNTTTALEFQFHGLSNNTLVAVSETGATNTGFWYSPFGEVLGSVSGGTSVGPAAHRRRMNDKEDDALSGLTYYGFRYVDRGALIWSQSDPLYRFSPDRLVDVPRRRLLYTFTLNNPLRYTDPDGRDPPPGSVEQVAADVTALGIKAAIAEHQRWLDEQETWYSNTCDRNGGQCFDSFKALLNVVPRGVFWTIASNARPEGEASPDEDSLWQGVRSAVDVLEGRGGGEATANGGASFNLSLSRRKTESRTSNLGPNGGGRSEGDQRIVDQRRAARAERREAESRAANGQKLKGEGHRDHSSATKGPAGTRPSELRREAQEADQQRQRNIGVDEEHSRKPKGPIRTN
jgi:RHS repeat-associated protein